MNKEEKKLLASLQSKAKLEEKEKEKKAAKRKKRLKLLNRILGRVLSGRM